MQGDFTQLLIEEQQSVTWQSMIRGMPRGIMAFALRLSTNSLPSPDNLKRWGKRRIAQCPLCSNTGTLEHIINFCSVALNQGRYTWRHDSVLSHIYSTIIEQKPEGLEVFVDLPDLNFNGSTIPPDILTTTQKPDIVILNRNEKKIFLLELTCSLEQNSNTANAYKTSKYTPLKSDLEAQGLSVSLVPFEVGSRGHVTRENKMRLITVFVKNGLKQSVHKLVKQISKISLLCTFSIFHAFQQPTWRDPPFLKP